MRKILFIILSLTVLSACQGHAAPGACSEPGEQRSDFHNGVPVIEFCDGTNWRLIGAPKMFIGTCPEGSGTQIYNSTTRRMEVCFETTPSSLHATACNVTTEPCANANFAESQQRYNTTLSPPMMQFCNGSSWVNMSSTSNMPCCPDGFIPVLGDPLTGANYNFCVSKYHMKATRNVDGVAVNGYSLGTPNSYYPESRMGNTPWTRLNLNTASSECASLGSDFHLITNAEWMTIAKQIENNPANWSGGAVGSGFIPVGHSDISPNNSLGADDDSLGCYGTGNTNCLNPASGDHWQKRTLRLREASGPIIWDFSGNVYTWVASNLANDSIEYLTSACPVATLPANPCIVQINSNYNMNEPSGNYYKIQNNPFMYPPDPQFSKNKLGFLPANDAIWATPINYGAADYDSLGFGMTGWWHAGVSANSRGLTRGGYFAQGTTGGRASGIYSAWIFKERTSNEQTVGFRCVYVPPY